jgi:hypothetical protein
MRRTVRSVVSVVGLFTLAASAAPAAAQYVAYGVRPAPGAGGGQQLVRFNTDNPSAVTVVGSTGQTAGILALDFRPATGMLYGFTGSQLLTFDLNTGAATPVATTSTSTDLFNVGFDFNPTVDRIRIVDGSGRNLRVNPVDGAAVVDGAYTYAPGDAFAGQAPAFSAVAYTNNLPGATTTALFGLDRVRGTLVRITSPNGGTVSTVGSLGLGTILGELSFDIVTMGGVNFGYFTAAPIVGGTPGLFSVNLETGASTFIGSLGTGGLRGLAVTTIPEPGTWALLGTGLAAVGVLARRRTRRAQA